MDNPLAGMNELQSLMADHDLRLKRCAETHFQIVTRSGVPLVNYWPTVQKMSVQREQSKAFRGGEATLISAVNRALKLERTAPDKPARGDVNHVSDMAGGAGHDVASDPQPDVSFGRNAGIAAIPKSAESVADVIAQTIGPIIEKAVRDAMGPVVSMINFPRAEAAPAESQKFHHAHQSELAEAVINEAVPPSRETLPKSPVEYRDTLRIRESHAPGPDAELYTEVSPLGPEFPADVGPMGDMMLDEDAHAFAYIAALHALIIRREGVLDAQGIAEIKLLAGQLAGIRQ